MVVISISIIESVEQIISGIPKFVTIITNIPASIFYTLNGSIPTMFSTNYVGPIFLPTNQISVVLNIFATNGTDSSPIITEMYITDMVDNARLPHSATDVAAGTNIPNLFPFGTNPNQPMGNFLNPGDAGYNVFDQNLPSAPTGFDGFGNPDGYTNLPYNLENYSIIYSTTDAEGQTGLGIGNLPTSVVVEPAIAPPETTEQYSNVFDPRAFVIFQDLSKENPNDPPNINRQFFSLENSERIRDGNNFFNSGLDAPPVTGTFLKSYYNPRDNTITYYYIDTLANRWIISKTPYHPTGNYDGNLSGVLSAKGGPGAKYVYQWIPFQRRVLF